MWKEWFRPKFQPNPSWLLRVISQMVIFEQICTSKKGLYASEGTQHDMHSECNPRITAWGLHEWKYRKDEEDNTENADVKKEHMLVKSNNCNKCEQTFQGTEGEVHCENNNTLCSIFNSDPAKPKIWITKIRPRNTNWKLAAINAEWNFHTCCTCVFGATMEVADNLQSHK
jgi:hypothetical protein